jgi:hypothetical protein
MKDGSGFGAGTKRSTGGGGCKSAGFDTLGIESESNGFDIAALGGGAGAGGMSEAGFVFSLISVPPETGGVAGVTLAGAASASDGK